MTEENERIRSSMFGIFLVIMTVVTLIVSFEIVQHFTAVNLSYSSEYLVIVLLLIPLWFFGLPKTDLLKIYQINHYSHIFYQSVKFTIIGTAVLFALINILNLNSIAKEVILLFAFLNQITIFLTYVIANKRYMQQRRIGRNLTNILIIADESCEKFIRNIVAHREWGYNIMLIISDSPVIAEKFSSSIKVLKKTSSLPCLIKFHVIDEVFYCKNQINQEEVQRIIYACEEIGVIFRLHSKLLNMSANRAELHHFDEVPFITYKNTPANRFALSWKFIFDFAISSVVILLWLPFLFLIGLAIKLTSKGPVIFKQKRVGLRGREFYMYKFRTMVQDAEKQQHKFQHQNEMDGPAFKIRNDPRITAVGKFLRKSSLDELPQFFNVLKGDMSLVGPRPPIMREVKQYQPWQLRRLSMRPGITCIWQVTPRRNSISFEEWMKLDLQYIDNWSLKQDFMLAIKTIRTVIMGSGQ
jgi:exopolysaccharide biosynthesis polyprenyl glycosylphosphotransferase